VTAPVIGWSFDDFMMLVVALLLGSFCIAGAIATWRHWSENRRLRKHFRQ
jgi:hypothetical protein